MAGIDGSADCKLFYQGDGFFGLGKGSAGEVGDGLETGDVGVAVNNQSSMSHVMQLNLCTLDVYSICDVKKEEVIDPK